LLASARRRRHDFAILRAIGLDRRRTRLVLNSQGTAIGLVGLVVGVPLGLALGRALWRLISHQVPLVDVAPFALVAVLLVVPVTVVVANALAVWPGHRLARRRPADDLRTD
ncbi:MAG: putative transport system permease protein, partial [Actinomycetota bacterium]|nr:putative transport system permease protein [Actinomycetota bacterium]